MFVLNLLQFYFYLQYYLFMMKLHKIYANKTKILNIYRLNFPKQSKTNIYRWRISGFSHMNNVNVKYSNITQIRIQLTILIIIQQLENVNVHLKILYKKKLYSYTDFLIGNVNYFWENPPDWFLYVITNNNII